MNDTTFAMYSVLASIGDTAHHLGPTYRESVVAGARLAEEFGYAGTLLHYNFHGVDPWALVPLVLESTTSLVPLVATPPTAMPPHTLARTVAAMYALHGRRVAINVVTGADPAERAAIGDAADHDERYARAEHFVRCLREILEGRPEVTAPLWSYRNLVLDPGVPAELRPEVFLAGSSPAGLRAAAAVADVAVTHAVEVSAPESKEFLATASAAGLAPAIRLGILARPDAGEAWKIADERFPADRRGALTTAQKLRSESHWVRSLAGRAVREDRSGGLWLGAFASARSHAAYVVGDYDSVAAVLGAYRDAGVRRLLLDGPYDREEFEHTQEVLRRLRAPRRDGG